MLAHFIINRQCVAGAVLQTLKDREKTLRLNILFHLVLVNQPTMHSGGAEGQVAGETGRMTFFGWEQADIKCL